MADNVPPEIRSQIMARIRNKNTRPELEIRSALHRIGFRFRLHAADLPGKPDLVFPKYNAVIFVHGCFWHGHDCHLFRWPKTRTEYWKKKISSNIERDKRQLSSLTARGWRVATVWECAFRRHTQLPITLIAERCGMWLRSSQDKLEIRGDDGNAAGRWSDHRSSDHSRLDR